MAIVSQSRFVYVIVLHSPAAARRQVNGCSDSTWTTLPLALLHSLRVWETYRQVTGSCTRPDDWALFSIVITSHLIKKTCPNTCTENIITRCLIQKSFYELHSKSRSSRVRSVPDECSRYSPASSIAIVQIDAEECDGGGRGVYRRYKNPLAVADSSWSEECHPAGEGRRPYDLRGLPRFLVSEVLGRSSDVLKDALATVHGAKRCDAGQGMQDRSRDLGQECCPDLISILMTQSSPAAQPAPGLLLLRWRATRKRPQANSAFRCNGLSIMTPSPYYLAAYPPNPRCGDSLEGRAGMSG
ncbi:hypothetical protein J6590_018567 [Homalodisca vitripennis]|nr:hypothetical protein J6590_018567 [Homalodisca vitripennis]